MIPIARPELGDTEIERLRNVVESGLIADGDEVRRFEREFAEYCGTEHGVATSNGTTALQAALVALGIGKGDTVLTTPFSFVATANAIKHAGAEPVFADIDPATYNIDPESARKIATDEQVDGILVVHLYGLPAEMDAFEALAEDLQVPLIEDCAQAHGATYRGDAVGTFGDAACFSFYPTKNMTTGEGGIVLTDREDITTNVRQFIDHGRTGNGTHETVGHNFRLTNIAAAIGRSQLERLPKFIERRRSNAARLTTRLAESDITTPTEPTGRTHAYHQYTIRSQARSSLRERLRERDIDTGVYYPSPIHEQPAYDDVDHDAPVAERAAGEVLSVPIHPGVGRDDIGRISEVIDDHAV